MSKADDPAHYFTSRDWLSPSDLDRDADRVSLSALGRTLTFATGHGTFSRAQLDVGSRLLLETYAAAPQAATVCDLGCGWGAIGCFLAARSSRVRVALCDVSAPAVQLARFNVRQNALSNAFVFQCDGLAACANDCFDAVLCNPPVRAGNAVIARLFADAQRCLRVGGALWIVLRTAQGAKSWQKRLAEQFGACDTVRIENGFRVLKSVKR